MDLDCCHSFLFLFFVDLVRRICIHLFTDHIALSRSQTNRQTDTDRQTDRHRLTGRHRQRDADRLTDRHRQTDRYRQSERHLTFSPLPLFSVAEASSSIALPQRQQRAAPRRWHLRPGQIQVIQELVNHL